MLEDVLVTYSFFVFFFTNPLNMNLSRVHCQYDRVLMEIMPYDRVLVEIMPYDRVLVEIMPYLERKFCSSQNALKCQIAKDFWKLRLTFVKY